MPIFERDGIRLHYHSVGQGVPFIFQHGLGADLAQPFGLFVPPSGFKLLGFDCRHHGRSGASGPLEAVSLATFADDLLDLMDTLEIPRAIIGGISMGAAVALNFALRYPERAMGLVLHRPAWLAEPNRRNEQIFGFVARLIRDLEPEAAAAELKRSSLYAEILAESPDCANSLAQQVVSPRAKAAAIALARIPADAPNHDRREWRGIKVPTLVLASHRDPIHPFEFGEILAREIPGAEFRELTPKSTSLERYAEESQRYIGEFLQNHFSAIESSGASVPEKSKLC